MTTTPVDWRSLLSPAQRCRYESVRHTTRLREQAERKAERDR